MAKEPKVLGYAAPEFLGTAFYTNGIDLLRNGLFYLGFSFLLDSQLIVSLNFDSGYQITNAIRARCRSIAGFTSYPKIKTAPPEHLSTPLRFLSDTAWATALALAAQPGLPHARCAL